MGAVGFTGGAAAPTVPDEEMGKEGPVVLGNDFYKCFLHLHGVVLAGQAHPAGKPAHMGVDDDALGQIEGITKDHVRCFPADTGKLVEMFHGFWNFTAMVFDQAGGTATDGFGLGAKKPGGADETLQFRIGDFGKVVGRPASGKEGRGNLVDPLIGALGGEDRGDKQLQRVGVMKFAVSVGVGLF